MQAASASMLLSPDQGAQVLHQQRERLHAAIDYAIHFLPTQGPISVFVHHNTLHPFEDLPFEQAVIAGLNRYGCEPYLSEDDYRRELRRGRISLDDLRQTLMDHLEDGADAEVVGFGTRYTLRLAMLQITLHSVPDAELHWLLAESDMLRKFRDEVSSQRREQMIQQTRSWIVRDRNVAGSSATPAKLPPVVQSLIDTWGNHTIQSWRDAQWEEFVLRLMWDICHQGIKATDLASSTKPSPVRIRDLLLEVTGEDTDRLVNEVLIRFCSAFLDQGLATWPLPHREEGFAKSFATLFVQRMTIKPTWMEGMQEELLAILDVGFDPVASIAHSLVALGVDDAALEEKICATMLALKGWAGMIWQLETSTPWLPKPAPQGSLLEFLAIRLLLERFAIMDIGRLTYRSSELTEIQRLAREQSSRTNRPSVERHTHMVFQLAQIIGWTPQQLASMAGAQWQSLVGEVESFPSLERRRVLHAAYERRYQVGVLDAIAAHSKHRKALNRHATRKPAFLAVFCIDDREESFRRHLEEVDPDCETASAAGFFAVAMYYQGADHAHYRPLCPAIITPLHYVREEPLFSAVEANERRARRRRHIGQLTHRVHAGSRTMIGGWLTGLFGAVATVPLVARILAPRFTWRVRQSFDTFVRPPATELHIERVAPAPGPQIDSLGYSLDEMAGIVLRILQDIGVLKDFPPILVFFGHGSSSLNNPHESAYNCGACSGGRGGPNARAFALMANDPRVRRLIEKRGVKVPEEVRFVGAFHNTCSDGVEYYDLDDLPRTHRPLFRRIERNIDKARARNAHERARRFESAPLDLTPHEALEHVEQRAEDLSQVRPEYNHATNAVTLVGRREWSRGLYMDRRAFLTSYDPNVDDEDVTVLSRILGAAIPVCAGISLEYYFSTVDTEGYGCGSKLPHNITSMLGVMTGAASDLRPGLSQQMVEIHEPMRCLFVIETTPEKMNRVIDTNPWIARLVKGNWVRLALIDAETSTIQRYIDGRYERYSPESAQLPEVESSLEWYRGQRGNLGFAAIKEASRPHGGG